jgi:hypothetical protein
VIESAEPSTSEHTKEARIKKTKKKAAKTADSIESSSETSNKEAEKSTPVPDIPSKAKRGWLFSEQFI